MGDRSDQGSPVSCGMLALLAPSAATKAA
jgi:hypothetical protein